MEALALADGGLPADQRGSCRLAPPRGHSHLREAGSSEGTVGLTVDEEEGVTGFGPTLMEVARQGHLWHLTTVAVGGPAGPDGFAVFAGPFATDDWPSRDFTALVAVFRPGRSPQEAWLKRSSGGTPMPRGEWNPRLSLDLGPVRPSGGGGGPDSGPGPAGAAALPCRRASAWSRGQPRPRPVLP